MAFPVPRDNNSLPLSEWIRSHIIPRESTHDSLFSNYIHLRHNDLNENSTKEATFSKREVHIEDSKPVTEEVYLNEKTATQAVDSAVDKFELCIGETETGSSERGELCVNPSGYQPLPCSHFHSIAVEVNFDVIPQRLISGYKPKRIQKSATQLPIETSALLLKDTLYIPTSLVQTTTDGDERIPDGEKFIHVLKSRSRAYNNAVKKALNVKNLKCYVKVTRKLRASNSFGKKAKTS